MVFLFSFPLWCLSLSSSTVSDVCLSVSSVQWCVSSTISQCIYYNKLHMAACCNCIAIVCSLQCISADNQSLICGECVILLLQKERHPAVLRCEQWAHIMLGFIGTTAHLFLPWFFFSCKVSVSLPFSPSPGGCEGEPQEEGDGGEDQASQASEGESWAGKAGTAAEEKATDWHEQRYSACAQLELAAASNIISRSAVHRRVHRSTLQLWKITHNFFLLTNTKYTDKFESSQ